MVEEYRARQIEAETERDAAYWVGRIRAALDVSIDQADAQDRVERILEEFSGRSPRTRRR